jgi:hypothetical protein
MLMERSHRREPGLPPVAAMASVVRRGAVAPAVSDVDVLEVAAVEGAPSTAVSEMLALQRSGDTARGD